ncbi:hypothetical protein KI387_036290, partial [Taxus chinensis]
CTGAFNFALFILSTKNGVWHPLLNILRSDGQLDSVPHQRSIRGVPYKKRKGELQFQKSRYSDQPLKFANVHRIFGESNITKLLKELPQHQREVAVNTLAFEADARLKDPVYGLVGTICILQRQVHHLQCELVAAHANLAHYTSGGTILNPSSLIHQGNSFDMQRGIGMAVHGSVPDMGMAMQGMGMGMAI